MVKYPRVLDGGSYSRRLSPFSCEVYQSLQPLSTANMVLPDTDELKALDWVAIETPDGKTEYYRAVSVSTNVVNGERQAYLEHGACTLGDIVIPDTSTSAHTDQTSAHGADLVDYTEDKTDTVANLVRYVLGKQGSNPRWRVGTIEPNRTIYVKLGGHTLLDALTTIVQYVPEYQMEFEQRSESEWYVNVKQRPSEVSCEGRLSRNLETCDVSYSVENLVTRVYCDGVSGGHIDSSNISVYGLRSQTMSLGDELSASQKADIVRSFLGNRDHPTVSVSISGIELQRITGADWDAFTVGKICRLAIPWLGMTVDEVVIDKRYDDILSSPDSVKITLANATPDLVIAMASIMSSAGGYGGGMAGRQAEQEKENKRFETHFEQTDEYFKLIATDTQWDAMGQGTLTAYGQITLTASSFETVVANIGKDGTITAASIALAINEAGSLAVINADHIQLQGFTTIDGTLTVSGMSMIFGGGYNGDGTIETNTVECKFLDNKTISAEQITASDYVDTVNLTVNGNDATWQTKTIVTGVTAIMPALGQSSAKDFMYKDGSQEKTLNGKLVTSWTRGSVTPTTETIYYLGR